MEITFTLRKNGGYASSSVDGRSFPMDRQADENLIFKNILNLCNLTSNWFFR